MCNRLGKRARAERVENELHLLLHPPPAPLTETVVEEATLSRVAHAIPHALPPFAYTWAHVMRDVGSWRGYHWVAIYGGAGNKAAWRRRLAFGVKFPLTTPYKERIRVLDSLVDLCNIRWGGTS